MAQANSGTTQQGVTLPQSHSSDVSDLQLQSDARAVRREQRLADELTYAPEGEQSNAGDNSIPQERINIPERKEPRNAAERQSQEMEALADRRREKLAREQREALENGEVDEELHNRLQSQIENREDSQGPAEASDSADQNGQVEQEKSASGFYQNDDGVQMVRLIVDGKSVEMEASKALSQLQKLNAGDQRLQEAAVARQELERQRQLLQASAPQQPTASQPSPTDVVKVDVNELHKLKAESLRKMYNGEDTADEIAEIDSKLFAAYASATAEQVPQIIQQSHQQRAINEWASAVNRDEQVMLSDPEYTDLTSNIAVWKVVTEEAGRLTREHDAFNKGLAPLAIMQEAAQNIRNSLSSLYGQPSAPSVNARQQRKSDLGNTAATAGAQVSANARVQPAPKAPDGGPTPRQQRMSAIEEIRQAKGEK